MTRGKIRIANIHSHLFLAEEEAEELDEELDELDELERLLRVFLAGLTGAPRTGTGAN